MSGMAKDRNGPGVVGVRISAVQDEDGQAAASARRVSKRSQRPVLWPGNARSSGGGAYLDQRPTYLGSQDRRLL